MKYLFLLLLSVAGFNAYSQIAVLNADSARLGNPAGTGTVALHGTTLIKNIAEGNAADSVLVRGSDGAVRFVKRSSFGALGIPFSNGDNLPGSNYNGRFLFNTSLQKFRIYDATAGTWKDALPGGNYVQLNPASAQTGSMNITGGLTFTGSFYDFMWGEIVPNISTIVPTSDQFYPGLDIKGAGVKFKNTSGNTYADFNPGNTTLWGRIYVVSDSNENRYIQNYNRQTQRTVRIYSDAISFEKQFGYVGLSLKGDNITGNKVLQLPDENGELLTKERAALLYGSSSGGSGLNFSNGLTNNSGTITNNLSTGIAGGQEVVGGTGANDALILKGTTGNGTSIGLAVGINAGNNGSKKAFSVFNDGNIALLTNSHVTGNFQIGEDGSNGNFRYTSNGNASWFGIFDSNNNTHYGFANDLGAPIANFSGLGGWYKGIGILANTQSGNGNPIFGVNTGDQGYGANGVGGNMFGVKADKTVTTFNNVLDNGNGGARITGTLVNDVLNGNQSVQTNANKELISVANTGTGNNVLSDSPELTGTPSAPTAPAGSNNNILANTAYVHTAIANLSATAPIPNLNQVLNSGNTSSETAVFGRLGIGGTPVSGYTFSSISSGASNFNSFSSSQGIGEFGIYDNSFYFAAETVSDGIKFFGNANALGLKVTNTNAIHIPNLNASQSVQTNANKELISVANTGTGDNVLATSPTLVTPVLGVAAATSVNKVVLTAPDNTAVLTLANNSSLITSGAFSNTLTTTATSNNTLPSGTNTLYSTKSASVTSAQLATTLTDETGTGTVVLSASPTLTGTPTAPTAASGTNTTQLATTAYVQAALSTVNINTQTANYTLVLADAGKFVQQNVSSANNVTVPSNASVAFPVGTQILLRQMGSGQVTVVAASGVTLQSADNALKSRVQFAPITLIKVATNTWAVMGDLTN